MVFVSDELFDKIITDLYENDDFFYDEHPHEQEIDLDLFISEINSIQLPHEIDLILEEYLPLQPQPVS